MHSLSLFELPRTVHEGDLFMGEPMRNQLLMHSVISASNRRRSTTPAIDEYKEKQRLWQWFKTEGRGYLDSLLLDPLPETERNAWPFSETQHSAA